MKPSLALECHRAEIRQLVAAHRASNPRIFGSVARGEDTEASDLDLLVDMLPGSSLFDLVDLHAKLEALVGVEIDLLTPPSLSRYYRDDVIGSALPV